MSSADLPSLTVLTGPVLIGTVLTWGLYGTLATQCIFYYFSFPGDHVAIKFLVLAVLALESLQTAAGTDYSWRVMVSGWGDDGSLFRVSWSIAAIPLLSGLISTAVQFFFIWRVFVLSKWRVAVLAMSLLALAQGASALTVGIRFGLLPTMADIGQVYPNVITWLAGSSIADLVIAGAMVYVCRISREDLPAESPSLALLGRIAIMSVETGMITTAAAIGDLVLELTFPGTNLHLAPCIFITKLYSNSMLVSLNARAWLGERRGYTASKGSSYRINSRQEKPPIKTLEIMATGSVSVDTVVEEV